MFLYDSTDGSMLRQVTCGDECNVERIDAVDERRGLVYFSGTSPSLAPLEKHLYRVSLLETSTSAHRLTPEGGQHSVQLDRGLRRFICVSESAATPPEITVRDLDCGRRIASLFRAAADARIERLGLSPPAFERVVAEDGTVTYGALYRPCTSKFGPGPYPTVVSVYGGPQVQSVADRWSMTADMRSQHLRARGFLVWKLDNRGSARRGHAFEASIYGELGTRELEDQVRGVRWLVAEGLADPARVGVAGWSYGGYLALSALGRAPDVFRAAIAGAPVTAWDGYDTHYTERYLGLPGENPGGYERSSAVGYVNEIRGRLLLIHGMIDENVHFRHVVRLVDALNRARVDYDLVMFPDER